MITPEKITSIQKRTKSGEPAGELRAELERDGFTKEEIDQCFPEYKYNLDMWVLVFAIIFLLIAVLLLMGGKQSFLMGWTTSTLGFIFLLAAGGLFMFRFKAGKKEEKK